MNEHAADFIKDWQGLARQSWDSWTRQWQPQAPATGNATVDRAMAGLKGYFDWMQGMAAAGSGQPGADWQGLLKAWTGAGNQPFTQAFGSIDNAAAQGFVQQWQAWLKSMQGSGFAMPGAGVEPVPAFGLYREQLMQQQELGAAIQAAMQANVRYQELIGRANAQGLERLQTLLAQRDPASPPIDSVKGLYDLWVDAAEDAYAQVALSDEFRKAYGEMVNTQMRVRQLQQQQTSALCREMGLPTREDISALGKRLQELRRERWHAPAGGDQHDEILALRREVNTLKRELGMHAAAGRVAPARNAKVVNPRKAAAPARAASKRAVAKPAAASRGKSSPSRRSQPAKAATRRPGKR